MNQLETTPAPATSQMLLLSASMLLMVKTHQLIAQLIKLENYLWVHLSATHEKQMY